MFLIGWSHKFVPPIVPWFPLGIFQLRTPPCDSVHGHFLLLLIVSFLQLTSVDQALLLETHWPARPQFPTAVASCDFRVEGESSRLSQQGAARCDASGPRRSAVSFNIHQTEPVGSGRGLFLETWQPNKHRLGIHLLFFLFKLRKTKCKVLPHE